jgi:hypothetical protein
MPVGFGGRVRDPRSWRKVWRAWRRAPWSERRTVAVSCVLIAIVAASLRSLGVRRTLVWTNRVRPSRRGTADERALVSGVVTAVRRAERYGPVAGTCLSRSLALRYLLARAGVATDLRFGGHRRDGRFEGHAWLEHDGVPLNDTPDVARRMAPFRPSSAGSTSASPRSTLPRSS